MDVGNWTDDIRVVTAVPSPGPMGVMLLAGVTACSRRRRR
jgi:MYXO-CTERM domain-containing protein